MCASKTTESMPISRRARIAALSLIVLLFIVAAIGQTVQAQPSTLDTIQRNELRLQERTYTPAPPTQQVPAPSPTPRPSRLSKPTKTEMAMRPEVPPQQIQELIQAIKDLRNEVNALRSEIRRNKGAGK